MTAKRNLLESYDPHSFDSLSEVDPGRWQRLADAIRSLTLGLSLPKSILLCTTFVATVLSLSAWTHGAETVVIVTAVGFFLTVLVVALGSERL